MFIQLFAGLTPGRLRPVLLLVGIALVAGCELSIGGPESAAIAYVRKLVDATEETPDHVKIYSHLPNRVVVEYARALKAQGIDLQYKAQRQAEAQDGMTRISVTIIPKRSQLYNERQHTLLLTLKREGKQGWSVLEVSALP